MVSETPRAPLLQSHTLFRDTADLGLPNSHFPLDVAMCRLNPRVDFAFKKLFGSEENSDLLISLINSIVSPEDRVARIELKKPL